LSILGILNAGFFRLCGVCRLPFSALQGLSGRACVEFVNGSIMVSAEVMTMRINTKPGV
jgi:hypothetical protein